MIYFHIHLLVYSSLNQNSEGHNSGKWRNGTWYNGTAFLPGILLALSAKSADDAQIQYIKSERIDID